MKINKLRNVRKIMLVRLVIIFAAAILLLLLSVSLLAVRVFHAEECLQGTEQMPTADTDAVTEDDGTELDALKTELNKVRAERDRLSEELAANESEDGKAYADAIVQLSDKDKRISDLENQIELLSSEYSGDAKTQARLFSELATLIATPPQIEYEEELQVEVGSEKETVSVTKTRTPKLALCYLDLTTGYTFSFSGDTEFDSASVVKAPYALSVLRAASDEQRARQEKLASGISEEELGDPVYDFTDSIIYTKEEYFRDGSGVIVQGEEGKEYIYEELFTYLLSHSDNVAYSVLTDSYGHTLLRNLVRENGWTSMYTTTRNMSARDACDIMKAIYEFTESGEEYSALMKNALVGSAEQRLTMSVAKGRDVAHKYGWDVGAYHDIGIVYDEHPYAVAIFSDYDNAEPDQVAYMQSLLSKIDEIHREYHEAQ